MCGNSAYDWNVVFTGRRCGGSAVMSRPPSTTCPALGTMNPPSVRNSVVLPDPEPPSSTNISPLPIARSTPSNASTVP